MVRVMALMGSHHWHATVWHLGHNTERALTRSLTRATKFTPHKGHRFFQNVAQHNTARVFSNFSISPFVFEKSLKVFLLSHNPCREASFDITLSTLPKTWRSRGEISLRLKMCTLLKLSGNIFNVKRNIVELRFVEMSFVEWSDCHQRLTALTLGDIEVI